MGRFRQTQMSSSSSYSSMGSTARPRSGSSYGFPKKCFCGLDPVMRTSTTVDNPGRRFFGCRNYDDGGYHIMKWWDEAMTEEFNDVKMYVDQQGQLIDGMFVSSSVSDKHLARLHDDLQVAKSEIALLHERLTEKQRGLVERVVEMKSLLFAGATTIVLIISICVAFF